MANQFRKNNGWSQYGVVVFASIVLMVMDARTTWLTAPRNGLAIAVSPIQFLASLPTRAGAFISGVLSAEPNVKIAYQNLRNEYFQLKSEMLLLRTLQEENQRLRSLLDASERLPEKVTLAKLMDVNVDSHNHRLLVGRGIRHGVYAGQAVIDDRGVVGQVTEVMPFNSTVMLITDPGHALPVQIQRTSSRTVVEGTGALSLLRVPFLNQNSDIQVGDILISSGLGGRFPQGYPVAEVSKVELIQDEEFIRVSARPIANLDSASHVLLLSREMNSATSSIDSQQQTGADGSTHLEAESEDEADAVAPSEF